MISHREVCKGWTKDKVMLSWGKPNQIEKPGSHEQWIYNEKEDKVIFFFDEDKITKILVPKQVKAVVGVPLKKANKYNDNAKPVTDKKNPKTKDEFENYQEVVGVVK
jgi:ribosomal protein L7/L12